MAVEFNQGPAIHIDCANNSGLSAEAVQFRPFFIHDDELVSVLLLEVFNVLKDHRDWSLLVAG